MPSESGETHDVKDFHFKQMRRLRIGSQPTDLEIRAVNLLAVTNTFGLTFVGFSNGVQVFETALIERYNDEESVKIDLEDFECMIIPLNSSPTHISLSCDDLTLAVCCEEGNSVILKFFDVGHFNNRGNSFQAFLEYELCAVESGRVYAFVWNNGIPNLFAIGLTNGSALELEINNKCIKQIGNLHPVTSDSNEFDRTATSALCWSPKGKQLVVGKRDGSLTQYKSSFHETKSIPGPDFFETHRAVLSVLWISNLQFIVTYYDPKNRDIQPCVVIVETPKSSPIRYISFDDVCFASSSARIPFYFLHYFSQWNILFCLSNNASETAVLHLTQSNENIWNQWFLEDSGRAELPLIKHSETYAYGIALDLTAQKEIQLSDTQVLPPQPIFLVLSSAGLLCPFHIIYDPVINVSTVNLPSKISSTGQLQEESSLLSLQNQKQSEEINLTMVSNPTLYFTAAIPDKTSQQIAEPKFPSASSITSGTATTAFTSSILPGNSLVSQQTSGHVLSNQGAEAGFHIKTLETQAKASSKRIHQTNLSTFPTQTRFSNKPLALSSPASRISTANSRLVTSPKVSSVSEIFNSNQLKTSRVYTRKTPCQASASLIHEILASDHKNVSRDSFTSSILEEAAAFQKELNDLRSRNCNLNYEVGTKEEMINLKKKTESIQQFIEELKETILAQNNEVHELKMMTIGTFQVVEEGRARQQLQQDPSYLQLLRQRGLDPVCTRKMKEIRKCSQYLDNWMREVNHRLDMEWEEYEKKRKNILWKGPSSLDLIYNTLCNNQNIIVDQSQRLDELVHELQQLHLRVTPKWQHQNLELSFNKGDTQLSSLAESLIEQDIDSLKTPPSKFLSPEKQANLRALLEKRQITPVRTASVNILNLSKSPSYHLENLEISDVENEIDEYEEEEDIEDDYNDLEEDDEEISDEENFEKYMTKEELLHTSFPGNQSVSGKHQTTVFGQPIKPFGNLIETDVKFQASTRKTIMQPYSPSSSPEAHIPSIQTFSNIPSASAVKNKVSTSFNSIITSTDTSVLNSQPLTKPFPVSTSNTLLTSTSGIITSSSTKSQSVFSFNASKPVSNFTITLPATTTVSTSSTTSAAPTFSFKLPSTIGTVANTFQFKMPENLSQPNTSSAFSFPGFSFKNNSELLDKTQLKEEASVSSIPETCLPSPSSHSVSSVSPVATPVFNVSSSLNANVVSFTTSENVNLATNSIATIAPSTTSANSSFDSTVTSICVSPNDIIIGSSITTDKKAYTIDETNAKTSSETTAPLTVSDNTESTTVTSSDENFQKIPADLIQPTSNVLLPDVSLTLNIDEVGNLTPVQEETIKSLFGSATSITSTNAAVFGGQSSINAASGSPATSTGFNQTVDSISNIFGQSTTLFSPPATSTATSAFGQSPTSTVNPLFSQPTTPVTPIFGQTTTSVAPVFGQSSSTVFRQPTQNIFGQPTSTLVFNPEVTTTSASVFSQPIVASTTTTSLFAPSATTKSTPLFNQATTTTSSSIFGQSSANSGFGFGSQPAFGQSQASSFKFTTQSSPTPSTTTFGFGQQQTTASTFGSFGQSGSSVFGQNTNVFGQSQTSPSGSNLFGQSFFGGLGGKPSQENASKNVFGGSATFGASSPSGFLSTTFGGSPVFGSTPLGFSGSSPGSVFGSTMNQNQSTAFSPLATNSNSAPTFGSLASQGSPTFGNLANSSPPSFNTPSATTAFGSPSFGTSTFGVTPGFGSPQQPSTTSFSQWR